MCQTRNSANRNDDPILVAFRYKISQEKHNVFLAEIALFEGGLFKKYCTLIAPATEKFILKIHLQS